MVGIATTAISIGITAMKEPNTNASTISAPRPATRTSIRMLTLVSPPSPVAESARSASRPVTSTGVPPTVTPASAACACVASACPGSSPGLSGIETSA